MELIGKAPINPILFYSGKITGYILWLLFCLSLSGIHLLPKTSFDFVRYLSYGLLALGILLTFISLVDLGKSTRFGLPTDDTKLVLKGLYRFSRNPMYLGLNLLTISSMIYFLNVLIILAGIFSIVTYHLIIIAEERFLKQRFGQPYDIYLNKVRRYL